jgi:15-cis-phytoene synthase
MRPGGEAVDVQAAYRHCEQITWTQARNFSYGIRLLPPAKRQALAAVYAFARRIDDIGDGDLPKPAKLAALADARASVTALGAQRNLPGQNAKPADANGKPSSRDGEPSSRDGEPSGGNGEPSGAATDGDLVLVALTDAAGRFDIPLPAFGELIDGCEADVRGTTYRTFDDLLHYCRCVAGSIGRLSLGVFGTADVATAAPLADALGVALQLTNILRDIREDYLSGRIYLPAEDFERFGCSLENGALHKVPEGNGSLPSGHLARAPGDGGNEDKLAALVEFEAQRACTWYARGLTLIPLLDRRSAASAGAMAGIYFRLLQRIAASPRAVLERRMSLSAREKAMVAARSLAVALRPRGVGSLHNGAPVMKGADR